jgi:hypothetical protein
MKSSRLLRSALLIMIYATLVFVFETPDMQAQGSAYISGYVFDPSNAVVPGVDLQITNEATGTSVAVKSNEAGLYRSPTLPAGTYTISAERTGFKSCRAKE